MKSLRNAHGNYFKFENDHENVKQDLSRVNCSIKHIMKLFDTDKGRVIFNGSKP